MGKTRTYTNGEVTVVWEASKCIHSAKCVAGLPNVFKPKDRPWIQLENANTDTIIKTVKTCPSGALTQYLNAIGADQQPVNNGVTKIEVMENGPLIVHGPMRVTLPGGAEEEKSKQAAFCRCGKSDNQPYCDGTHNTL